MVENVTQIKNFISFYFLFFICSISTFCFPFLLIIISVLITVNMSCCLKKHQSKQEYLLPYYYFNNIMKKMSNKLSEINIKDFTSCFFDDVINIKNLDPKSR